MTAAAVFSASVGPRPSGSFRGKQIAHQNVKGGVCFLSLPIRTSGWQMPLLPMPSVAKGGVC